MKDISAERVRTGLGYPTLGPGNQPFPPHAHSPRHTLEGRAMRLLVLFVLGVTVVAGCKCPEGVKKVNPSLGVSPPGLDFGQVKVSESKQLTVRVESQTQTSVVFSSIVIEGAGAGA